MEKPEQGLSVTAAFLLSLDAKGGLRWEEEMQGVCHRQGNKNRERWRERETVVSFLYRSQQEIMSAAGQKNSQEQR